MKIDREQWSGLSALLDAALEIDASEREAWLQRLPSDASALKEPLRTLLAQRARIETGEFLKAPDFAAALRVESERSQIPPIELQAASEVGAYRLLRELGRGGMGSVWLAERIDGKLKRQAALKFPYAGPNQRQLAERLARERDILAGLEHPNIARLYDADVTALGQPFLVLEYVDGISINDYCDQQRLTIRERLVLFLQVLNAVQYAHTHLVIHRDLKPSNILINNDRVAQLLDFGIAKLISEGEAKESALTQFGGRALTPDYASPEQINGESITTACDVYSLGVVLYELLTGSRPYRLKRDGLGSLEAAIMAADVIVPNRMPVDTATSQKRALTAKQLSRALKGDLDTIILKALRRDPSQRYASADALAEDVRRYLDGEPVAAQLESFTYRTVKFVGRHRLAVAATAVIIVTVIIGTATALWQARQAEVQRDRALAMLDRNEAVTEFLNSLITDAAGSEKPITVNDMLARSERLIELDYRGNVEHQAAVLAMLGMQYHSMGNPGKAEPLLNRALAITEKSRDQSLRAKLTCDHAIAMAGAGKVTEAKRDLSSVIANPQTETEQSAECLGYLAAVAMDTDDAKGALQYSTLALQRLQSRSHKVPTMEAAFLGSVGFAMHLNGRNDEAERYYGTALKKLAEVGRDRSRVSITIRSNWAVVSDGAGDPKRALELYDETLQVLAQLDPTSQPPPYLIANRARALEWIGRYKESLTEYEHGVSLAEQTGNAPVKAYCLLGIASVNRELGDLEMAETYFNKMIALVGSVTPGSPPDVTRQNMQGRIALSRGNYVDAHKAFNAAIGDGATTKSTAIALIGRAEVNLMENHPDAAIEDARRALTFMQALQGGKPYSNRTGLAWLVLARAYAKLGETTQAREALQAAITHLSNTVDADHPALKSAQTLLSSIAMPVS